MAQEVNPVESCATQRAEPDAPLCGVTPAGGASPAAPIRLMYLISSLEHGGAERQVVLLANRLDPARFDVTVCSLAPYVPLAATLRDRERRLHIVEKRWKADVGLVRRVARLMRAQRTQAVHCFLFDAEMVGRLAALLAGRPVVFASERNTDYVMPKSHWIGRRLTRSCFDLMIANSEAGKRFNMRTLGIAEDRIHVIRNGVDLERFQPVDRLVARASLELPADVPVIGMIATFKRQKNHGDFLRAAERLHKRFPEALFVCVGEPMRANQQGAATYHGEILTLLETLSVKKQCRFLGTRDDMPAVYSALDILVLPSEREGTPNVLLEAMACGTPVVATDVADNAAVAPDGQVGYIVPFGDVDALTNRLERLLLDVETRHAFGRAARAWVSCEFSTDRLVEQMSAAYDNTVRRVRSSGARRPAVSTAQAD